MDFTFPDSGRTVTVEGISFLTLTLIRGWYEQNYPNKPTVPQLQIDGIVEDNPRDPKFLEAMKEWQARMGQASWAAVKLYYASCVTNTDVEAVNAVVTKMRPFVDLKAALRSGFEELAVPFQEEWLDPYIYLFHICITNAGEQTLFDNVVLAGSAPTQEAVQQSLFRIQGRI